MTLSQAVGVGDPCHRPWVQGVGGGLCRCFCLRTRHVRPLLSLPIYGLLTRALCEGLLLRPVPFCREAVATCCSFLWGYCDVPFGSLGLLQLLFSGGSTTTSCGGYYQGCCHIRTRGNFSKSFGPSRAVGGLFHRT